MGNPVDLVKAVALALGELNSQAVFVGGATVPFYLPESLQATARPTDDVDLVIELAPKRKLNDFEDLLRKKGFKNDISEGAPICRWKLGGLTVDIMTPDEDFHGFTNRWYADGVKNTFSVDLEGVTIQLMTLPFFLATKLVAFKGRGNNDFLGSSDIEDIITVIDGADENSLRSDISKTPAQAREYLTREFNALLKNEDFLQAIPGAVPDRLNSDSRAAAVVVKIRKIAEP